MQKFKVCRPSCSTTMTTRGNTQIVTHEDRHLYLKHYLLPYGGGTTAECKVNLYITDEVKKCRGK